MLSVIYTQCHLCTVSFMLCVIHADRILMSVIHADCRNYDDHAECFMLNVTKLSAVILNVVMLNLMAPI